MPSPDHFLTFLAAHAEKQPDKVALRVSTGASSPDAFAEHTYAQLYAAVLALSEQLRDIAAPGERALILMPSGAEFITAFLACLHAGIIAVPAYPPRRNRNRERVLSIHDDAQPAVILTTAAAEGNAREALPETKARVVATALGLRQPAAALGSASLLAGKDIASVSDVSEESPLFLPSSSAASRLADSEQRQPFRQAQGPSQAAAVHGAARHNSESIAFLQYTSGSTGAPKGTIITHANLLANLAAIQSLFQHEPEHEVVTWLPPYHDMGLNGNLLTPLYRGMTVSLLTPDEFLRQPVRWLQVIASRQAFVSSGAPNFAYQLLAERVTDADIVALDLSRWRIAFNGAEPVQAGTLERFHQRFAPCGFSEAAWLPCYGLAETTLLASGRKGSAGFQPVAISNTGGTPALLSVSCGPPALDTRLTIHDRETGVQIDEGQEGEIHVHSPSVASGYWNNPAATTAAFPQPGTLRTGDLGILHNGELYVTGRVKDLIIIRGRNLYPHDVENCVAAQLPTATGANSIAAFEFAGNGSGSASLGLLIEAPRMWVASVRKQDGEITSHIRRIREAVAESFEVTADLIAFVAPGDFLRTSSGKVQRGACRDGVMNGTLPVIHQDQLSSSSDRVAVKDGSRGFKPTVTSNARIVSRSDTGTTAPTDGHNDDQRTGSSVATRREGFASANRGLKSTATLHDRDAVGEQHDNDMPDSTATADALILWLRAFAARRLNSQLMDERRTVAPHVVLEFGNHGLFGLEVPRALGGLGLSTSDSYRVMEQLAAIDLTLALLVGIHNALGLHPILRHGPPSLKEELLPAMAGGRHLASFAITELSAGSNPKAIETTAVRGNDGRWTINGRKQWIGIGSWAGTIVVIAKARGVAGEHLGSVALAVPADAEGVSFGPEAMTMGVRGVVQVPVFFDGVQVDAARVLAEVGHGFDVAYDAMRLARVGLAALSLGAMKRCLQWMTTYATEREVAGGKLSDLPATHSRLAETVSAIATVEALVRAVGDWLDAGVALPEEVFLICKTTAPELLGETADRAMQMLGARGYMENNGLPQLFRDARLLRIFEGPTEALNASLGARLRRGSDALAAWMESSTAVSAVGVEGVPPSIKAVAGGTPATPTGGDACATRLRSLATKHPAANDVALGELASLQFLLWIVQQSGDGEAIAWLEERLRQRSATADVATGTVVVNDITARLKHEIGAFDQTLPGEDWELDPLLRNMVATDRVAVKDGSRGFKPTDTSNAKIVSRSDTGTTDPTDGNNDDQRTGSYVATRRDDRDSANRGLKSTATFLDHYAVGEDGALIVQLERGLLDFLRREKLGNLDAVPHDATFSSLGIDSLGAASLAIEIEKTFSVKITDETLYDYPTLRTLAGYIESRHAPEGTPAEQGRAVWQQTLDAMNERVSRVKEAGSYFYGIPFESQDAASAMINGKRCVVLSGYSYLGLMDAPEIRERVYSQIEACGVSSHGSRMLANGAWHQELEALIAKTMRSEDALTFTTGFTTNWAVISTLMSAEDTIIADEWIHASLVDGCKGSGATFTFFRHNNLEHLAELLAVPTKGKTLVVIDAVYSMEGDIAPVPEISALAHAHGAWLMVDEAHSLGVLGVRGLGIQEHFSLPPDAIDIKMGTLSKAIPSAGGYIAGSADLIAALRHNVRPFIFSGAPTPPMVAAAMAGFEILLSQPERVRKLHDNIRFFRDGLRRIGLTPHDTGTAIIPLMCRDEDSTFTFAKRCLADGLYVTPIVFPAVPQNAPRIRCSITAALSEEDITLALEVIEKHKGLLV